jgi:hypothetical protein
MMAQGRRAMRTAVGLVLACLALTSAAPAGADAIPASFESRGADRAAIETVLHTYTVAVSTKNEALFQSLLLNTAIPFSAVAPAIRAKGAEGGARNYESFRRGVFQGPSFAQRFQDVHIEQDGPLAEVSLVFVNTSAQGEDWGWKTLQLLKVDGQWKIASEFYTNH